MSEVLNHVDTAQARSGIQEYRQDRLTGAALWLAQTLPTLVILAALGGLGYWGYHAGWKLPKFSSLTGAETEKDDWCDEHNVPESICVECNKALLAKEPSFGWCAIHGVRDCPWEHPKVAQLKDQPAVTRHRCPACGNGAR